MTTRKPADDPQDAPDLPDVPRRHTRRATDDILADVLAAAITMFRHPLTCEIIAAGCEDFSDQADASTIAHLSDELTDAVSLLPSRFR